MAKSTHEEFSDKEAKARFEAALRGARAVGHKPMSEMKVGKKASPAKSKRKKPGK
jgi:hypothetical protein